MAKEAKTQPTTPAPTGQAKGQKPSTMGFLVASSIGQRGNFPGYIDACTSAHMRDDNGPLIEYHQREIQRLQAPKLVRLKARPEQSGRLLSVLDGTAAVNWEDGTVTQVPVDDLEDVKPSSGASNREPGPGTKDKKRATTKRASKTRAAKKKASKRKR